jgi:hypothetical protein
MKIYQFNTAQRKLLIIKDENEKNRFPTYHEARQYTVIFRCNNDAIPVF